ncbi:hypothetical protein DCAR_0727094 [Daucus carota subsp. sativus]|uniref:Uncharacterized protein n=3 Tax=Daucus carota subsp. sativus TaxID=79200 RepID=A0AAF0XG74_DAUCS|nr:PREDICTED: uncharacterized protein LOC108196374 isoform X1 [Daucus carota subsp. sativus]WOH07661.1 hypothetical protein DCAR_0727094 [Daucus carota subsp. sativus]
MGKAREREQLNRILGEHLNIIHETLQALDQTADSSLNKVSWDEVVKMGEQVSKQATLVGMLWTGVAPEVKALEENMASYFNILQGFLLLSHGSTVGAGPTLSSYVNTSMKQVIDSSFVLWKESVSSYGSHSKEQQKRTIPQLVGAVWDACSALKKTPATNIMAIGRAVTQVAVPMKDVLREMKELKPSSSDSAEASDEVSVNEECEPHVGDNSDDGDMGNDLTPEEMKVAQCAIDVVSDMLVVLKELIRTVTLFKKEDPDGSSKYVDSLEKLLKLCQGIGIQIDELGACLYPPQEHPAIGTASEKISGMIDEMLVELDKLDVPRGSFVQACADSKRSLGQLGSELGNSTDTEVLAKIERLDLTS